MCLDATTLLFGACALILAFAWHFVELGQVIPLQALPVTRDHAQTADRLCGLISSFSSSKNRWTNLIDIHQYDLVRRTEVHFVNGINGIGDAFDHIVPLQSVVTADGRPDSVLQTR